MRQLRRAGLVGAGAGIVAVLVAAAAWACIPVATLNVSPAQARPGEQVTVTGSFYGKKSPVVLRFNTLDGPVVGTITPDKSSGLLSGTFVVPADARPGNYVLIATQEAVRGETTWGVPSRALLTVVGQGGAPVVGAPLAPAEVNRPVGLVEGDSVGGGELLLAGLGVAGVAMFLAGMAALLAGRRREGTAAVRVDS